MPAIYRHRTFGAGPRGRRSIIARHRRRRPMIHLHYYPGNASLTPHMLLEELGVPFKLEWVDRQNGAHKTPEYRRLNPNAQIPVMVDGDLVLYETAAILMH